MPTTAMTYSIPLARPNITQAEIDAVVAVLRTPDLSLGPRMAEFETAFARFCHTRHAVSCSSGTAALHMLISAMDIGPGDEVITTPFSFIASANCVLMERATPIFVDIDPFTWNIDPAGVEAAVTPRTKAVIPVDVFGQIADVEAIMAVANRGGLRVIEDSCEALGSRRRGRPAGSLGHAGVFGFYPNKQLTTGEGGMVVTDDDDLADACRSIRNQGRDGSGGWFAHHRLGYNFRLDEMSCALGLAQLRRIDEINRERERVVSWYRERLASEPRLALQRIDDDVQMSWFVMVVRLSDGYQRADRDRILGELSACGIGCNNYFAPIHLQPFYVERFGFRRGDFPICEALSDRTIALPLHHQLAEADVDTVCRELTSRL